VLEKPPGYVLDTSTPPFVDSADRPPSCPPHLLHPRTLHCLRPPSHTTHVLRDFCCSSSAAEVEDTDHRYLHPPSPSPRTPPSSLAHFSVYTLHRTRLTSSVTFAALYASRARPVKVSVDTSPLKSTILSSDNFPNACPPSRTWPPLSSPAILPHLPTPVGPPPRPSRGQFPPRPRLSNRRRLLHVPGIRYVPPLPYLAHFIAYTLHRTRLASSVAFAALRSRGHDLSAPPPAFLVPKDSSLIPRTFHHLRPLLRTAHVVRGLCCSLHSSEVDDSAHRRLHTPLGTSSSSPKISLSVSGALRRPRSSPHATHVVRDLCYSLSIAKVGNATSRVGGSFRFHHFVSLFAVHYSVLALFLYLVLVLHDL